MKTRHLRQAAWLPLLATLAIAGCDDSPDHTPPPSAMTPQSPPPVARKPPSTVEEKIKAIQSAPIPEQDKEKAIARVRSGQL